MTTESFDQPRCPQCDRPFQQGRTHCMWCGAELPVVSEIPTHLICPNCPGSVLQKVEGESWIVHLCPECEGVWMASLFLQRFESLFEDLPAQRIGPAADVTPPSSESNAAGQREPDVSSRAMRSTLDKAPSGAPLYRACPQCQGQMARRRYRRVSGIIIDECLGHGVWFDAGEFQETVAFLKKGGLAREKDARNRQTAAERESFHRTLRFFVGASQIKRFL